ncbi:MAG: hypothetical protein AB8H79_05720 [Myxococcota bacterium]
MALLALVLGCRSSSEADSALSQSGAAGQSPESGPKEEAFWNWFVENEERLRKAVAADARAVLENDPMGAELQKVHPALLFELSVTRDQSKQELTITADGNRDAFPAVEALVRAAPSLEHWQVLAFRQPSPDLDFEIGMGDLVLSPQTTLYRSVPEGSRLGITIYLPGDLSEQDTAKVASSILLDHVLGEYDVETLVGSIEWAALPQDHSGLIPLANLRDEVAQLKR